MKITDNTIGYLPRIIYFILCVVISSYAFAQQATGDVLLSSNGFYYRTPSISLNHLNIGDILAAPYLPKSTISSATVTDGKLPKGLSLFPNGLIVVERNDLVKEGVYELTVTTSDTQDHEVITNLSLEITGPSGRVDTEAIYKMGSKVVASKLSNGEILAESIDKDGSIKMAKCVMGSLPPGTQLTPEGKIVVTDHQLLVPNTYNAGIVTVDRLGGVTFFMVTVPIEAGEEIQY